MRGNDLTTIACQKVKGVKVFTILVFLLDEVLVLAVARLPASIWTLGW